MFVTWNVALECRSVGNSVVLDTLISQEFSKVLLEHFAIAIGGLHDFIDLMIRVRSIWLRLFANDWKIARTCAQHRINK